MSTVKNEWLQPEMLRAKAIFSSFMLSSSVIRILLRENLEMNHL